MDRDNIFALSGWNADGVGGQTPVNGRDMVNELVCQSLHISAKFIGFGLDVNQEAESSFGRATPSHKGKGKVRASPYARPAAAASGAGFKRLEVVGKSVDLTPSRSSRQDVALSPETGKVSAFAYIPPVRGTTMTNPPSTVARLPSIIPVAHHAATIWTERAFGSIWLRSRPG